MGFRLTIMPDVSSGTRSAAAGPDNSTAQVHQYAVAGLPRDLEVVIREVNHQWRILANGRLWEEGFETAEAALAALQAEVDRSRLR